MKKLRAFAIGMIGTAVGLLLYCGSFYVKSHWENRENQAGYESLRENYTQWGAEGEEAAAEDKASREKKRKAEKAPGKKGAKVSRLSPWEKEKPEIEESFGIRWKELRQVNPDITGWITIPEAGISYPVVQGEDNDYYLHHSIYQEEDPFGAIFLDEKNEKDFEDSHSFLYGHNMEGNMMFADLNRYEEPEFLAKCPEIYVYTPEKKFCYRIFSIQQAAEGSNSFAYGYRLDSREYAMWLEDLQENSLYGTGVTPVPSQPVLSLVTCNSRLDENVRMMVHGIRTEQWDWQV